MVPPGVYHVKVGVVRAVVLLEARRSTNPRRVFTGFEISTLLFCAGADAGAGMSTIFNPVKPPVTGVVVVGIGN